MKFRVEVFYKKFEREKEDKCSHLLNWHEWYQICLYNTENKGFKIFSLSFLSLTLTLEYLEKRKSVKVFRLD